LTFLDQLALLFDERGKRKVVVVVVVVEHNGGGLGLGGLLPRGDQVGHPLVDGLVHHPLVHQQTSFELKKFCTEFANVTSLPVCSPQVVDVHFKDGEDRPGGWRARALLAQVVLRQSHALGLPPPTVHEHPMELEEVGVVEHPAALTAGNLLASSPAAANLT